MAILIRYDYKVLLRDEHFEALRAAAMKRFDSVPAKHHLGVLGRDLSNFDPANLQQCADVVLGDQFEAAGLDYERSTLKVTLEYVVEPFEDGAPEF